MKASASFTRIKNTHRNFNFTGANLVAEIFGALTVNGASDGEGSA
jgi:hypothetical protein